MPFTPKPVADGQLAASQTTIYTVPGSTKAYGHSLVCNNVGSTSETVQVWVNVSGTARRIARAILEAGETLIVEGHEMPLLEAGDTVLASTTTATTVDYVLSVVEET